MSKKPRAKSKEQRANSQEPKTKEFMNIVIAGHVDHGKSTVIGRMLADTGSLPEGKLEQLKDYCKKNAKPFEYAFLLDALKDEQSQGITIDSARVFFSTEKRDYIIIDAPGHIEFLKNMVTGASRAESAILVIDAEKGVQENSRRHGYLISMLGMKQVVVLVNKMDLVDYSKERFEKVTAEYREFMKNINLDGEFIPVSGVEGDNIVSWSKNTPWYKSRILIEALDSFRKEPKPVNKPYRLPVQDVYKFTNAGDQRRLVAGTVESGKIKVGDEVVFYPSGKHSTVKTIEAFNRPPLKQGAAGEAVAFTLTEQVYINRGQIAIKKDESHPKATSNIRVNLFWMGKKPLVKGKDYFLKLGTAKVKMRLGQVVNIIDASGDGSLSKKDKVEYHDVAECIFNLHRAIAFDLTDDIAETGRFVIVDDYEIRGGGIIREALPDEQVWVRDYVMTRNYKWITSSISGQERIAKYNQKATLLLVTGEKDVGKKRVAKELEHQLFTDGRIVYFLGIGNVLYGVDADIKNRDGSNNRQEHIRRLGEVANLMLDAGMILIVTAIGLKKEDLDIIRASLDTDLVKTVWVGPRPTDIDFDLVLSGKKDIKGMVKDVKKILEQNRKKN